jgi:hypothetical protein
MKNNAQRARPARYAAASVAQYLHELSGRHADERAHKRPLIGERPAEPRVLNGTVALAGREVPAAARGRSAASRRSSAAVRLNGRH